MFTDPLNQATLLFPAAVPELLALLEFGHFVQGSKPVLPQKLLPLARSEHDFVHVFVDPSGMGSRGVPILGNDHLGKPVEGLHFFWGEELWTIGRTRNSRSRSRVL